ncbi:MAG: hypothetical protein WCK49_09310 [Myxococcaceae bacterium]
MQLIYSSTRKTGIVGQKTDSGPSYVVSAFSEKAVEAGTLVVFDGDQKCRAPATKEDLGFALGMVLSQGFAIKPGSMLSILRSGRVWVEAGGDIAAGSSVFVNLKSGAFVAQESPEAIKLKNACFLSSGKKDDVVELELNLIGGAQ